MDKYLGYLLIAFLWPVTRILGLILRPDHSLARPPKHILFIKILGLGSLFTASDRIKAIKQRYPQARLLLLADHNIANGIEPQDLFDELWRLDSGSMRSVIGQGFFYLSRCWRLRDLWVVDLEVYSKLTTVYALLTCAINRFGFSLPPVFFRKYLNTHNILFGRETFLEDNYAKMAEAIIVKKTSGVKPMFRANEYSKPYIAINNTLVTSPWCANYLNKPCHLYTIGF